jgi:choline kinase
MNAIILAAGRGTRIARATHGVPKCLIDFGGQTILDHQIEALWAAGVARIGIVVGHNGERIVEHVGRMYGDCLDSFDFIYNTAFATTNNIYSLWLAREWAAQSGDFLCLNADVLCHPAILLPAVSSRRPVSMIVDPSWREETMKVIIRKGNVIRMSKSIPRSEYSATYIGITAFRRQVVSALFDEIGAMLAEGRVNEFFNAAVQRLVDRGVVVGFTSTGGLPWAEIDDEADLLFARTSVAPLLQRFAEAPDRHEELEPAVA